MRRIRWTVSILLLVLTGSLLGQNIEAPKAPVLTSPAFQDGAVIPRAYTCQGKNISPPLSWMNIPKAAKSLALVCVDPDAPRGRWVHWVVYGIPPEMTGLEAGLPPEGSEAGGLLQGQTDFGRLGWGGPCPPPGKPHHYIFTLSVLDALLELKPGLTIDELNAAIKGHVLSEARLTGIYER
jgi:Raf kinase inhibitor-like YbhB/YbcL family protein